MTRQQHSADSTPERTSDQSAQTASGVSGGSQGPEVASEREVDDVLNRNNEERYATPRRYEEEEKEEEDNDPAVPGNDPALRIEM